MKEMAKKVEESERLAELEQAPRDEHCRQEQEIIMLMHSFFFQGSSVDVDDSGNSTGFPKLLFTTWKLLIARLKLFLFTAVGHSQNRVSQ